MNKKEYSKKLSQMPGSRINHIITAVNRGISPDEFTLRDEVERMFFDQINEELKEMRQKYGDEFCFSPVEIEYDDPVLDIYSEGDIEEYLKRREGNTMLEKAIAFATECHKGQVRKGTNIPYITHPLEVLDILKAIDCSINVQIAGVLHDTVEDTKATIEQIKELFGSEVAQLVGAHSENKSLSWQERKEAAIEEVANASFNLKCVVLADKLSNMRAIRNDYLSVGESLWYRFNAPKEKQGWYYSEMIDALEGLQNNGKTADFY